jgi:hypothetical protein
MLNTRNIFKWPLREHTAHTFLSKFELVFETSDFLHPAEVDSYSVVATLTRKDSARYIGCYAKSFKTLKEYTNLYRGNTQRLNCYNVAKLCKFNARNAVVHNTATATAPAVQI